MPIDDREQQFERALARHLRDASGACPDAEILAAYHERTLSLEEMARWKEHIAACERCQEALALVEQTEAVDSEAWQEQGELMKLQQVAEKPMAAHAATKMEALPAAAAEAAASRVRAIRRPRANWKWIAPMGAIAAGAIVWIGTVELQKRNQNVADSVQIAENRRAAEQPAIPQAATKERTDSLQRKQAEEKELRDESSALRTEPGAPPKVSAQLSSPKLISPRTVPETLDKKKDGTGQGFGNGLGAPAPATLPPVLSADEEDRAKNEIVMADRGRAAVDGQLNAPMAGANPAPPAPQKSRAAAAAKPAEGYVPGRLSAITGTVLDPSGAGISGAVITAIDTSSGNSKTAVADATGKFQLMDLPSDQYRVIVAHSGFAQSEQTLTLQPLQKQQLQVQLKLGSTSETVEVSAGAAAVNTENASVSKDTTSINTTSIDHLPLNGRNYQALMQLAAANPQYIVAPDRKAGWRVGDVGKIERTTDNGKSWKVQASGVSADLRTGSATSGKVCWVIGKAGTILRTTDGGKHWKQIASPISDDLGGIHAVDAQHASIWDVANRKSFETSDGGVTWKPAANE